MLRLAAVGSCAAAAVLVSVLVSVPAHAADPVGPVNVATCNGKPVTQVVTSSTTTAATGTPGDDVIAVYVDRPSAVSVAALAGNDTVCVVGLTGFATIDAGDGDDYVSAAATTTNLQIGTPTTVLLGAGNDTVVGSPFSDVVQDTGAPTSGDDVIDTGAGFDSVLLHSGVDQVTLGTGYDRLTVDGLATGTWSGGASDNTFDSLVIDSGQRPTAKNAPKAIVDLNGLLQLGGGRIGSVTGFADVTVRGFGKARVTGTAANESLKVQACRTVLDAGAGNDSVDLDSYRKCGAPSSRAHGGAGDDVVRGAMGADQLYGDGGRDRLYGRGGADLLDGGGNNDKLFGDPGNDVLRGGGGQDKITGDAGFDVADGGNGRDTCSAERRRSC